MNMQIKDYLATENVRNKENAALYERVIRLAFREESRCAVIVGHHLTFEFDGRLNTENEVPSADTLMFDHEIMHRVFGMRAIDVMQSLARVPVQERDALLERALNALYPTGDAASMEAASDARPMPAQA